MTLLATRYNLSIYSKTRARKIVKFAIAPFHIRLFAQSSQRTEIEASDSQLATEDVDYGEAINILNKYQVLLSHPRQSGAERTKNWLPPRESTKNWLLHLGCDVDSSQIPKVLHVAGTKGKGTTCLYCSRILVEHQILTGKPKIVGCLTSPHQIDVRERILINNEKISKRLFSHYVRELDTKLYSLFNRLDIETPHLPKYPGFLTLLAIYIFTLEKVDIAVLETGIGGGKDSTNVFPHPIATGITSIGLDHVDVLGHTVEEIAWHKAGIFKSGSLAGTVPQEKSVLQVLREMAREKDVAGELQVITDQKVLEHGVAVYPDMPYQRYNAGLAIFLAEAYLKSTDPDFIMTDELARSLQDVELLGKSQIVEKSNATWYISSAHNETSLKETVSWYKQSVEKSGRSRVLVFSQPLNRDPLLLLKTIYNGLHADSSMVLKSIIFCNEGDSVGIGRYRQDISALNQQRNSQLWKKIGGTGNITIVDTPKDAVSLVTEEYKGAEVLVTGSAYLSGSFLQLLS